jgi:hypothetical protein
MNSVSTVCVIQSGQFKQIHDGRKYNIVELTKYPAFPLRSPGGSHPHFTTLVQNKLPPQVFIFQVHGVICDKDRAKEFEYEQKRFLLVLLDIKKVKQSVPLPAWSGPVGSRKLRFPDFMTTAQDGGKVVSLRHRPPLPPGNTPGTHFC